MAKTIDLGLADGLVSGVSGYYSLNTSGDEAYVTSNTAVTGYDSGKAEYSNAAMNTYTAVNGSAQYITAATSAKAWTITATSAADTIVGGTGADTFVYAGGNDTITGGAGADTFDFNTTAPSNTVKGTVVLTDYKYGEDTITANGTDPGYASYGTDGVIVANNVTGTVEKIDVSNTKTSAGYYQAEVNSTKVWFTGTTAVTMDAGTSAVKVTMIGSNNTVGDTLKGSTLADTIYAGTNDTVDGGSSTDATNGIDAYHLTGDNQTIVFGMTSGADTADGFTGGTAAAADKVYLADNKILGSAVSFAYNNATVKITDGSASTLTITEGSANDTVLVVDSTGATNTVRIAGNTTDSTMKIGKTTEADYVIGSAQNPDISFTTGDTHEETSVAVDLSNAKRFGDTRQYQNITQATGSTAGTNTLAGGTASETLTAGGAATTLWGGYGTAADELVGGTGQDTFFYGTGEGADIVTSFTAGTAATADILNLYGGTAAKVSRESTNNAVVYYYDAKDSVTVATGNSNGTDIIQYMDGGTEVKQMEVSSKENGADLKYAADIDFYYGTTASNTGAEVLVAAGTTNASVWLDGRSNAKYMNNITAITSSVTSGTQTLAGGSAADTITVVAGNETSTVWGGYGTAADKFVLKGGTNVLFYGAGEGKDEATAYAGSNTLYLYGFTAAATVTNGDLDGESESGTSDVRIASADGSYIQLDDLAADTAISFTTDGTNVSKLKSASSTATGSLTYAGDVDFYYGATAASVVTTLNVTGTTTASVWLDGRNGQYFNGNITTISATAQDGAATLAGGSNADTISAAGAGDATLWGGYGTAADTITGNSHSGSYTYYYGMGEGADTFKGITSSDKVFLYNASSADVTALYAESTSKAALKIGDSWVTFENGSASTTTFTLGGDNTSYTYNWTNKTMTKNA